MHLYRYSRSLVTVLADAFELSKRQVTYKLTRVDNRRLGAQARYGLLDSDAKAVYHNTFDCAAELFVDLSFARPALRQR